MKLVLQVKDAKGWRTVNQRTCEGELNAILAMAELAKLRNGWEVGDVLRDLPFRIVKQN